VQHCAGSRSSAVPADQVQREHFIAGMRVTKPGGEHCARQNNRLCFAVVKFGAVRKRPPTIKTSPLASSVATPGPEHNTARTAEPSLLWFLPLKSLFPPSFSGRFIGLRWRLWARGYPRTAEAEGWRRWDPQ